MPKHDTVHPQAPAAAAPASGSSFSPCNISWNPTRKGQRVGNQNGVNAAKGRNRGIGEVGYGAPWG